MRELGTGVLLLIGTIVLVVVVAVVGFAVRWYTAPVKGKLQAREQIFSGSNRIQAYEHFFDLCTSVQTQEAAIKASREQLKTTTNPDDKSVIATNITASITGRSEAVAEYNNNAAKNYNEGQFRASNLPYRLPIQIPERGTQCAY